MKHHLRNAISYLRQFGATCGVRIIWQKALRKQSIFVQPQGIKHQIRLRSVSSDFKVLRQVIGEHELELPLKLANPATIIDAGANIGLSSIVFANQWPNATIIAIEPEKANFKLLQENTQHYPNIHCIYGAVSDVDGKVTIDNPEAEAYSFRFSSTTNPSPKDSVDSYSIRTLMDRYNWSTVDVLKMDIEGAEDQVFGPTSSDWIDKAGIIVVEPHERYAKGVTARIRSACAGRVEHQSGEYLVFETRK